MIEDQKEVPFSPTEPFRFCPADGTPLGEPRPSGGVRCPECSRSWYRNSAPSVGAAIVDGDRALVTVRAVQPEKGKVDVPGGFLEAGEHPVEGLMREVREELGVEVQVDENPVLLATHTYGPEENWVLAIGLRARIVEGLRASRVRRTTWRRFVGSPSARWTGRTSPGSTTGSSCSLHYRVHRKASDRRSAWTR